MIVDSKSPPRYSYREIETLVTDGAFGSVHERGCRSHQAAIICLDGGSVMARTRIIRSKEEKLAIVKEVLAGKSTHSWEKDGIDHSAVRRWVKRYQDEGEAGLEVKRQPHNALLRFAALKNPTYEEQLLYKIELLKHELAKKEAEVACLKQRNARKGGDTLKK